MAGCEARVIMQSEDDGALFYLPQNLTEAQANSIVSISAPRRNFQFSFAYREVPYDNISYNDLLTFVRRIIQTLAKAM